MNRVVYQYDTDKKLIKSYPSARVAAKELTISRISIQHACTGRCNSAGGFLWSYNNPWKTDENNRSPGRKVAQYSNDELIKLYNNVEEASLETRISKSSIYAACNKTQGRKSAGGYQWEFQQGIELVSDLQNEKTLED